MVNKVMLIGHLGKDPEFKAVGNDGKVVNFTLATSESYTGKDGKKVENTEWHNIVAWGGLAENISKFTSKGSKVYVEGKIKTRSYDNKEGVKQYRTEIVADTVTFLDRKGDNGSSAAPAANTASHASATSNAPAPVAVNAGGGNDSDNDDLPF
jgi:single-strand DNA-binding protein